MQTITLTAADGHVFDAWCARPAGKARGGLVVLQEAFGVNAYVRGLCEGYAARGYVAVAPAIYDRQERHAAFDDYDAPEVLAHARKLRGGLVWDDVLRDVAACVDYLRPDGKVGVVGYCVGGSIAWLAALSLDIAAASAYYGRDVVDFLDRAPRCPVQLHFGADDHMIEPADVEAIRRAFPELPVFVYPGGHAFAGTGKRRHEASAALADERTMALFSRYVG